MSINYGERKCLVCGADFVPTYASQVTCSPKCRHERTLEFHTHRNAKRRDKITDLKCTIASLSQELDETKQQLDEAKAEISRLRSLTNLPMLENVVNDDAQAQDTPKEEEADESESTPDTSKQSSQYEHVCPVCGKTFRNTHRLAKYCSPACRSDAKNAQKREAILSQQMHRCERMKLSQLSSLPCGKYDACFIPFRCESCPPDAQMPEI